SKHIKDMEMELIKKMLSYYPAHRPTSIELSKSPYLPPPELEETEQLNIIRKIVADPKSKSHLLRELVQSEYKHLSNSLFVKHENGYTNETLKQLCSNLQSKGVEFRFVCSTIKRVLKKYCFSLFSLPLFLPNPASKNQENYNLYEVMDRSGCVLCPPHDLRLPFARYVAMNDVKYMRRFDIQKVFRQSTNSANNSPDELWQCSIDFIVAQKSNSAVSCHLEIITILNEIINEFPALRLEACNLRLNHTKLMDSIRSYYNVIDERIFQNFVTVKQLKDVLRKQVKAKPNAKSHHLQDVNEALNEISEVIQLIKKNRDSYFKLLICPNLAFDSTAGQSVYSGLIFQVDFEFLVRTFDSKKKDFKRKIIAHGGQYNEVIEQFERDFSVTNSRSDDTHLIAVGATIDLENVVNCELADKDGEKEVYGSEVDVIIWCSEEISSDV
ncbi:eukaryotic translation initiation factor 2-alpha kinase 4-like isoform X2, partial [Leptotrombidium deliense]